MGYVEEGLAKTGEMYKSAFSAFKDEDNALDGAKSAIGVMHKETTLEAKIAVPLALGSLVGATVLFVPTIVIGAAVYGGTKLKKFQSYQKKR